MQKRAEIMIRCSRFFVWIIVWIARHSSKAFDKFKVKYCERSQVTTFHHCPEALLVFTSSSRFSQTFSSQIFHRFFLKYIKLKEL